MTPCTVPNCTREAMPARAWCAECNAHFDAEQAESKARTRLPKIPRIVRLVGIAALTILLVQFILRGNTPAEILGRLIAWLIIALGTAGVGAMWQDAPESGRFWAEGEGGQEKYQ